MKRILRIDLSTSSYRFESIPDQYVRLGGRGLSSAIVSREVPPKADPLSEKNKVVLAPGILAGTTVTCSGRLSIGTKSPLTHTIKEANSGGELATQLAKIGIHAVIIEGRSAAPILVKIDKQGVTFESAKDLKGVGNYRCLELLKTRYGKKIGALTIGPAGEQMLKASAIAISTKDAHLRFAARGGVGAVLGSKNLKAIVVDDEGGDGIRTEEKQRLNDAAKSLSKGVLSHPLTEGLKALGTPLLVNMINSMGALSTKNFSRGKNDSASRLSGETLAGLTNSRPNSKSAHACMTGCVVQCSNILTDEQGELVCSSIEFETIALMGSNCLIDDVEMVAKLNYACNDMGLDTMDVGCALAVAMEAGLIPWGDGAAALSLIREIETGGRNGIMIGNGVRYTGEKLGVKRIPVVKGQSLSGYDPRGLKGTGVTYATATMGADHTCGNVLPSPTQPHYNPLAPSGQAEPSKQLQVYFAAIDSLGLCLFPSLAILDIPALKQHLIDSASAVLGEPLDERFIENLGEAVLQTERSFNLEAGFTRKDDRLPEFFTYERLPEIGTVFDVSEKELDSVHP